VDRFLRLGIAVMLLTVATSAFAATRYVTDELRISVRTGAGNQYRIVEVVSTGTRLETIETAGEWTRVRVGPSGKTGWVRTQYLADQPVAADRLAAMKQDLSRAQERASDLEQTLEETRTDLQDARERIDELTSSNQALQQKVDAAKRGLELSGENDRLRKTVKQLNGRISELEARNTELADRKEQNWFMIGGGVLFAGILFGIIVTRIPWRRRNDRMF